MIILFRKKILCAVSLALLLCGNVNASFEVNGNTLVITKEEFKVTSPYISYSVIGVTEPQTWNSRSSTSSVRCSSCNNTRRYYASSGYAPSLSRSLNGVFGIGNYGVQGGLNNANMTGWTIYLGSVLYTLNPTVDKYSYYSGELTHTEKTANRGCSNCGGLSQVTIHDYYGELRTYTEKLTPQKPIFMISGFLSNIFPV